MRIIKQVEQRIQSLLRLTTAGLDISDQSVKYLSFRTGGKNDAITLAASGEFPVPEGMIVKGEIQNEDELVGLFSTWRAGEKRIPHSTFFVVSLPEEKSFLRVMQLPKMKEEEIEHALRWEIEANIPLAFEDLIYDYEVVAPLGKEQPDHLDVEVTAFPKTLVDTYVRVLHRAGLSLAAFELESQAIVRSVVPDFHEGVARVIADIGRTRTSFVVCVGGVIVFTTTIQLGGQLFENNLAKAFQISQEEAHMMKMRTGVNKKERDGAVFNALLPTLAVLADELSRVVGYYRHHAEHMHGAPGTIESIILVGGDANLSGIETYLASALQLPVCRADPFTSIIPKNKFTLPPLRKNEAVAFATVVGLALRGIRS